MTELNNATAKELQRLVSQIERLNEEIDALAEDAKDKFKEAKDKGFDVKILRKILAIRKKGRVSHEEEEALITTYLHAIGFQDTPLGNWAEGKKLAAVV